MIVGNARRNYQESQKRQNHWDLVELEVLDDSGSFFTSKSLMNQQGLPDGPSHQTDCLLLF
jgi:hypothetical protein